MTIVVPIASNYGLPNVTPSAGDLRGWLINTGINIAETVITNYLHKIRNEALLKAKTV